MDVVQTVDGGRRNMYDPDEIEEEQRERERRNKINAEFQQFVKRVQVGAIPVLLALAAAVPHVSGIRPSPTSPPMQGSPPSLS